jgi:hypothetical protein
VPDAELELQREYNVGNYLLSLENASRTAQRVQDIELYGLDPTSTTLRQADGVEHGLAGARTRTTTTLARKNVAIVSSAKPNRSSRS